MRDLQKGIRRTGFTLLELLIVIAIFAILLALLLSGIQSVRLASFKTKASNQMRELGLAYHMLCDSGKKVDSSVDADSYGYGEIFQEMLPFIGPTYAKGDLMAGPAGSGPSNVNVVVNYINPGDISYTSIPPPSPDHPGGDCSYAINSQIRRPPISGLSIPDGTSQTIAFSERYSRCKTIHSVYSNPGAKSFDISRGTPVPVPCSVISFSERRPTFADPLFVEDFIPKKDAQGNTVSPSLGFSFQTKPLLTECNYRGVQSSFPSGLLVTMADGSVHTLSPSIDAIVFWSLVTPAGNESHLDW